MYDIELLHEILNIEAPWHIMSVSLNKKDRRLDVHVGYKGRVSKTFFGFARKIGGIEAGGQSTCPSCQARLPNNDEYKAVAVRHLPIAGFSTYLFVPPSGTVNSLKSDCSCMLPWRTPGTSCTPELYKHVVNMLTTLGNYEQVRDLLDITVNEMRQIRDVTDIPEKKEVQVGTNVPPVTSAISGIPEFNHPNWMKLVKGELTLKTKVVALSMLLNRTTAAFAKNPNMDLGVESVKVLRHFFTRNERMLKSEISILNGAVNRKQSTALAGNKSMEDSSVPAESSLVWQLLLQDEKRLKTKQIALQMLLSRARTMIKASPTEATNEAEIKKICNYFVRNESKLGDEISQLRTMEISTK